MKIIQSRLDGVAGDIVEPDAIQFASRKVAAVSGDARRALDICRRAVELAEASAANSSVSGEINRTSNKQAKVSIATIMKAINEATSNPIQQHIRGLPLMIKVTLIAIVQRLRRTGIAETTVGDVSDEVKRNLDLAQNGAIVLLGGESDSNSLCIEPASVHCGLRTRAPALRDALLDLASAGIVTLESHRTDRGSKIRLAVGTNEIIMALKEDVEMKELSILIPTG
jgi:origin recognition complex subunit 1